HVTASATSGASPSPAAQQSNSHTSLPASPRPTPGPTTAKPSPSPAAPAPPTSSSSNPPPNPNSTRAGLGCPRLLGAAPFFVFKKGAGLDSATSISQRRCRFRSNPFPYPNGVIILSVAKDLRSKHEQTVAPRTRTVFTLFPGDPSSFQSFI